MRLSTHISVRRMAAVDALSVRLDAQSVRLDAQSVRLDAQSVRLDARSVRQTRDHPTSVHDRRNVVSVV